LPENELKGEKINWCILMNFSVFLAGSLFFHKYKLFVHSDDFVLVIDDCAFKKT